MKPQGEELRWSEPWTGFSARTGSLRLPRVLHRQRLPSEDGRLYAAAVGAVSLTGSLTVRSPKSATRSRRLPRAST